MQSPEDNQPPTSPPLPPPQVYYRDPYASLPTPEDYTPPPPVPQQQPTQTTAQTPISQPQSDQPSLTQQSPQKPSKLQKQTRHLKLIAVLLVAGLVITGGWLFLRHQDRISVSPTSLHTTSFGTTRFMYPSSWQQTASGQYTDPLASDNIPLAKLLVIRQEEKIEDSDFEDPDSVNLMRTTLRNSLSNQGAESYLLDTLSCSGVHNINLSNDTEKTKNSAGLLRLTANCTAWQRQYQVSIRFVIGADSHLRTIGIIATPEIFKKNSGSFETILRSLDQTNSSQTITYHASSLLL